MSAIRRSVFRGVKEGREQVVIQNVQDCSEIVKINEMTRLANGSGTSSFWKNRQYVKIASIPMVVLDQWEQQGIKFSDPNAWPVIKRMLNSGEFEGFRTAPGRF
jgi:hypothetical protein